MKRIRGTIGVAVLVALLAAVPVLAQTTGSSAAVPATGSPAYLQLLVTINKLDLSQTQMQQVHDILASILTKAQAIKSDRDAFVKEMLAFNGTQDELNALLSAYQKKVDAATSDLRTAVTQAVKDISGILTIEQGRILEQAFPGLSSARALGLLWRGQATGSVTQNQAGQTPAQGTTQTPAQQFGNQRGTAQAPFGQWCPMEQRGEGPSNGMSQRFGMRPGPAARGTAGQGFGFGLAPRPGMGYGVAGQRLSFLQEVVNILEAKLEAGS
jgi:hypothetical protein